MWLRPLDTAALLTARGYSVADRLVQEIIDPVGLTGGRFALDAAPQGATCRPTTESADLTLGISQLGSVSLGGYSPSMLVTASLVDEHTAGAAGRADAMFRSPKTPWSSLMF